jgi:hypothetical protein
VSLLDRLHDLRQSNRWIFTTMLISACLSLTAPSCCRSVPGACWSPCPPRLVFTSRTHVNIRDGNLFLPERVNDRLRAGLRMGLDALIVTVWLAIVIGSIFATYGALLFA